MQIRSQIRVSHHHELKKITTNTLSIESLSMAPASTQNRLFNWKTYLFSLLFPFVLAGCAPKASTEEAISEPETPVVKQKTIDYRWAECSTLNAFYHEGMNNALYWLRTIECTNRLMSTEAQRRANNVVVTGWGDAFYKSILLERAGLSIAERRNQLVLLESYKLQFPSSMRVLLSIWINNQTNMLSLAEEKMRYRRLSTETDNQIDLLKKQNNALESELKTTLRKLESLTQIERQLSSRKQGGAIDTMSPESPDDITETMTSVSTEKTGVEKQELEKKVDEKNTAEKSVEQHVSTPEVTEKQKTKNEETHTASSAEVTAETSKSGSVSAEKQEVEKPTETGSK